MVVEAVVAVAWMVVAMVLVTVATARLAVVVAQAGGTVGWVAVVMARAVWAMG